MIQKQSYHSNSKYKVCAKISADDPFDIQKALHIDGQTIEIQDLKNEFKDKYTFSLNAVFQNENSKDLIEFTNENIL